MFRSAFAITALAMIAMPAAAASYSAKPAMPAKGRIIGRDIVWSCGPAACQGATDESRPVVLCQSLAKQAGHIDSFMVDGHEFSQAELGTCNSAARSKPPAKLASQ